jgi:carboxymethylenebutenolidase
MSPPTSGYASSNLLAATMKSRRSFITRLLGLAALSLTAVTGLFKIIASAQGITPMSKQSMIDTFQKHVGAELAGDLETTMATMSDEPHLNHVPTMAGGVGREGVRNFYRDHLVGKFFPPDVKMTSVSSTVGDTQIVDELFITFTHTTVIDWLLPGVAPTGKPVEMAVAVVVGFKGDKITHEHIYWDQAGILVQVGLLDPKGLPVTGAESARKVLNPKLAARQW